MPKKMLLFALLMLLLVSSAAAQDATTEPTAEVTAVPTAEATAESTSESTAEVTPEPTAEITAEPTSEATIEVTLEATAEATAPPGAYLDFPGAGSYTVRLPYGDIERSYRVYIPEGYSDEGAGSALVIVMHGAGGNGATTETLTRFNALADTDPFVVVYPDGINNAWNDGREGDPRVGDTDDVHFLSDIVSFMGNSLNIDPLRVYATGYSMGGMMAYRLGCERPDLFAAVGSVASTMPYYLVERCNDTQPIPLIVFHGTDDRVIPWTGIGNAYLSAAQTIGYWANHNGCTGDFTIDNMPDADPTDHTQVMRQVMTECAADMVLYGVFWGGHTWPGHPLNPALQLGQTSMDVDASALQWEFFKAHLRVEVE
jgi:polyhydroxybutyrate depolymerase